jgi:predicted nuclease with TOPRIM domain
VTTATKMTPAEVRDRLREILDVATEYAASESKMRRLAGELLRHEDEWTEGLPHFESAAHSEIKSALVRLMGEEADLDALEICHEVQDAIHVLDFAIERGE